MKWKGFELKNMGDVITVLDSIYIKGDKDEALVFKNFYRSRCEKPQTADSNIGYWIGNWSGDEARKRMEFFEVEHPVFGRVSPGPDLAFKMGVLSGRVSKGKGLLKRLRNGCWCDAGRGKKNYMGAHNIICREIQEFLTEEDI